jgi:hypothetical protein
MTKISVKLATIVLFSTLMTAGAIADNTSVLTVGVGGGIGTRQTGGGFAPTDSAFVNQANVRVKALWVLGADLSMDLTRSRALSEPEEGRLNYASKMRLTALIYALPTDPISVYVGGGIGAPKFSGVFDPVDAQNTYHLGGGVEVHATDHFTIDVSYYMIVPSAGAIKEHVTQLALASVGPDDGPTTIGTPNQPSDIGDIELQDAVVGDYINPENYEIMVRIFLFL